MKKNGSKSKALAMTLAAANLLVLAWIGFEYYLSSGGLQPAPVVIIVAVIAVLNTVFLLTSYRRPAGSLGVLASQHLEAEVLMNSMADGVLVVDQDLKVRLINPAAQTLIGWDQASAQGINYRAVMHLKNATDQDIDDATDPFMEAWHSGNPLVRNNLAAVSRAGNKLFLSISISPIFNADHTPEGGIAVFRDISRQKEIERQRDEFISTASHEMRTPVASIEGYIALALTPKVAAVDERARNFLNKAHESTQHLGKLFRDLLSVTKLENQTQVLKRQPVELGKLLQDVTADLQFSAAAKKLSLTFSGSSLSERSVTPAYMVLGDVERLREALTNLVDNSLKYTPAGGVTTQITGDAQSVTVSISDTGVGIAAEDLPHLFQKFYRVDNTATRTVGGTGLGLYLCRQIIELHNGRIWVESQAGKGSSFRFTLPRLQNVTGTVPASTEPITAISPPAAVPVHASVPTAAVSATPTPETVPPARLASSE